MRCRQTESGQVRCGNQVKTLFRKRAKPSFTRCEQSFTPSNWKARTNQCLLKQKSHSSLRAKSFSPLLSWGYDYIASVISLSAKQGFYLLVQPRQLVIIRHGECVIAPAEPEFRTLARPTSSHAKSAKNSFLFFYLAHPGHGTRPSSARPT